MKNININYSTKKIRTSKKYELMVVACDPRNLEKVCNFDRPELDIFSRLQNFTFHTTLMIVPCLKEQKHGVVFAPYSLEKMQGAVYGFRNESAKKFGLKLSNKMKENLVTVYQLLGPETKPYTPEQFAAILVKELPTLDWWPFGTQYKIKDTVTTPYFDHFSQSNLKVRMPWIFLNRQGLHNTLYVHASTCFESALDCWGYENMLLANPRSARILPPNKSATIVIIGAGVSGLLFAVKLKRLGYTNIDLLESTNRYGGKTHTIEMKDPYPEGISEPTYCELGTCYMSPAYNSMIDDLKEYLVENQQIPFGEKVNRGIVTKDQLPSNFNAPLVMDSDQYVLRKAEAELNLTPGKLDNLEAQVYLFIDLAKYIVIHREIFGETSPMPTTPPQAFLNEHASKTFLKFLKYHNLEAIIGILQYGYEVQGYGTLSTIPAFYGLVWITTPIIETMIEDSFIKLADKLGFSIDNLLDFILKYISDRRLKEILRNIISKINKAEPKQIPIVTAWSKGWGDLWKQIVTKERLNILYNVKINTIVRS